MKKAYAKHSFSLTLYIISKMQNILSNPALSIIRLRKISFELLSGRKYTVPNERKVKTAANTLKGKNKPSLMRPVYFNFLADFLKQ